MPPLAQRLRPKALDEVVGQSHLLGPGRLLRRIAESGNLPNMVFYGPSGVGKTTVASILAQSAGKRLHRLNGTTASSADLKAVFAELDTFAGAGGLLLYLDEIQYLNKKQQQTLLEFIEDGRVTLIASTTDNPYFCIYNAVLSRCTVFEFRPVSPEDISRAVMRAFGVLEKETGILFTVPEKVLLQISTGCGGDVRKALNAVELISLGAKPGADGCCEVTSEDAAQAAQRSSMSYDRDGDRHYDILSAFQKSIRGSDADAALHYLSLLLEAGDLLSVCRRLLVIAAEDIGLAYPGAMTVTKACTDAAVQLGLPEARIPLAEAVILLSTSPKSNSAASAIDAALADVRAGKAGEIPPDIRDAHYGGAAKLGHGRGYLYPHSYPGHWVAQQYLPDNLRDAVYYHYGENKSEQAAKAYWGAIRNRNGRR